MSEPRETLPACFACQFGERNFPCRQEDGTLCPDRLADALLALAQEAVDSPRHEANFWAFECMDKLVEEAPETAFRVILFALPRFRTEQEIGRLAAGHFEDLVDRHGARMIDAIEREAAGNERFRLLLSGIWGGPPHTDPEVWRRIQAAVRPGPWLDDNPLTPQSSDPSRRRS